MTEIPPLIVQTPYFDTPLKMVCSWNDYDVYSNLLDAIARFVCDEIKNDNQTVILIRGGTGSGKSNLAMQLIKRILEILKLDWVMRDMYLYSLYDLAEKIDRGSDNPINWYDEAIITFNSLNAMTEESKLMGMFFDTMRLYHYVSILCMPNDKEIDKRITKHADIILECPDKVPIPGFAGKGFFEYNKRIHYKSGKYFDNRIGAGIFRPIPKKIRTEYEKIKLEKADEFKRSVANKILKRKKKNEGVVT